MDFLSRESPVLFRIEIENLILKTGAGAGIRFEKLTPDLVVKMHSNPVWTYEISPRDGSVRIAYGYGSSVEVLRDIALPPGDLNIRSFITELEEIFTSITNEIKRRKK